MAELKSTLKIMTGAILIFLLLISGITFLTVAKIPTSIASENFEPMLQAKLNKYINYNISEQDKGTLVQYKIKTGIEYEEKQSYEPIKYSEINVDFKPIDNKYPKSIKLIEKNTQATNGNSEENLPNCAYNSENGKLIIYTSNEKDSNLIYGAGNKKENDEYIIDCYYDTYIAENLSREIGFNASIKYATNGENNNEISKDGEFKQQVIEKIGELTST